MKTYRLIKITRSDKPDKKMAATFENLLTKRTKVVHFGKAHMSDYTLHKDPERKKRYIIRHRKNENWNDPVTAGALSRWVLWNKPDLKESISDYKKRFFS